MSLRLEMLKAGSRAPLILGESTHLVFSFLLSQQNPDGGFKDRAGQSDLYYLPFALGALAAAAGPQPETEGLSPELQQCVGRAARYLAGLGEGEGLDFVHLCSLARAWAAAREFAGGTAFCGGPAEILRHLEQHRTADGGYNPMKGASFGSAYGAFLACGAYQDLERQIPNRSGLGKSLQALQTEEGGFSNERYEPVTAGSSASPIAPASINASAAAVAVLSELNLPAGKQAAKWLLARMHSSGGFLASPTAPGPDLLSTATGLHALATLGTPLGAFKERSLDFVDSLWSSKGGFYGYWGDDRLDCEYAFYGLLALGHLQNA